VDVSVRVAAMSINIDLGFAVFKWPNNKFVQLSNKHKVRRVSVLSPLSFFYFRLLNNPHIKNRQDLDSKGDNGAFIRLEIAFFQWEKVCQEIEGRLSW
jgi:hypothetical protein